MNVLNSPNSEYRPSGEHAPVAPIEDVRGRLIIAAQELVSSASASIPNTDPTGRLERATGPRPDEVIFAQERIRAQKALRRLALGSKTDKSDFGLAA